MEPVESRVALAGKGLGRLNDEFVKAAERGDCPEAQRLLGLGASIDARCLPTVKVNSGAVEVSSEERYRCGTLELRVSVFNANKASYSDLNWVSRKRLTRTALQAASDGGNYTLVKLLIDAEAEVNAPPAEYGRTALQAAAGGGHQEIVKLLIDAGAEVNAPPAKTYGRTALQAAAEGRHREIVELLIDAGAEVNAPPAMTYGRTALQAAAGGEHWEIVKLLIDAGAKVNAEPAESYGRTTVQAAAEGGHREIVKLLIDAGAEVNAPPAGIYGRTTVQAAAEGGHQEIVQLLIDAGADVNAPPAGYGRTALQAAAGGGHQEIVQLLIDAGAELNAPPAENGRTALQAAAEGGHQEIVKLLIDAGAEVNAAPAEYGRTALQAAAEGGHREIVQLLIDAGVEVNMNKDGDSLLIKLASHKVRMDILELLLHAPQLDLTLRDQFGFTPLHQTLREYGSALRQNGFGFKPLHQMSRGYGSDLRQDYTAPGYALQADRMKKLLFKVLEEDPTRTAVNIKDHSGKTSLETALEIKSLPILEQLLLRGADTRALRTEDLRNLLDLPGKTVSKIIGLCSRRGGETHVIAREEGARLEWPLIDGGRYWGKKLKFDPWINISLGQPGNSTYASFMHPLVPGDEQESTLRENAGPLILENAVRMQWWLGVLRAKSEFYSGVPTRAIITGIAVSEKDKVGVSEKDKVKGPVKAGVIGYVCFCVFVPNGRVEAAENVSNGEGLQSFKFENQKVEISWIMAHPNETECESKYGLYHPKEPFLRSLLYLGTVRLKYLSIPSHGVEFATLFLDDIHRRWLELLESAKVHLVEFRDKQLVEGGKNPTVIQRLLEDSQQWSKLRSRLKLHISKAQELWDMFKEHEALFMELAESEQDGAKISNFLGGRENSDIGELKAMMKLSRRIKRIEGCMREIDELKGETKEMIELEFNLVSIYEARKSIEMSEISNKMAERSLEMTERSLEMSALSIKMTEDSNKMAKESNKMSQSSNEMSELSIKMSQDSIKMAKHSNSLSLSMKRLSWITFIFLPLTFVSGLFGMNLDILANNPSWTWYFVIAGPVLALIFVVWIIFKYVPISHWIEKNIGSQLEVLLVGDRAEPTTANVEPVNPSGLSSSGEVSPRRSSLRMRLIPTREKKRLDDIEQGTTLAPPKAEASEQVTNLDSDSNLV